MKYILMHKGAMHQTNLLSDDRVDKGAYTIWVRNYEFLNSIMWAAAILIVAIVEEKHFAILMLVILSTTSLMSLKKGNERTK